MPGLQIITTKAGRAALVNAEHNGTAPLKIAEVGITAAVFTANEDMIALPGEFKRLSTISGEVVAPDTMHVTIRDDGSDTYTVRGIGYWLSNGVLLGVYSQPDPILQKSTQSMLLLAADTVFTTIAATSLSFGNANFTNPPASTERQGVVELATLDETVAGKDATRAVTPAGLTPALVKAIATHTVAADPHAQYLTAERGNALYFHTLAAIASSDTDCNTLIETGVRDVTLANDRGILTATNLPIGGDGFGTLLTVNGGTFIVQRYTEGGATPRTWERTGFAGQTNPFQGRVWKQCWDSNSVTPGDYVKRTGDSIGPLSLATEQPGTAFTNPTLELREAGRVTTTKGRDISYAPKLVFHWAGYAATQLRLTDQNILEVMEGAGNAYGSFQAGSINAMQSLSVAGQAVWHAGNFNPGAKQDALGYFPVQQGTGIGQTPNAVKIGWSNGGGVKITVDATDMGSVVLAPRGRMNINWNGIGGQPAWMLGGNTPEDVNVYNPLNFNVNYANSANYASNAGTASYATQLTGQGLVHGGIGGYHVNKNHTSPELGGAWELRGFAYDFGSGGDGGMGTRTALWQRVA